MEDDPPAVEREPTTESHVNALIERFARADLEELREQLSAYIGLALCLIGGTLAWAFLPTSNYRPEIVTPSFWTAICGVLIYALRKRSPVIARLILLAGPTAALGLSLNSISTPVVPFMGVILIIACSTLHPLLGVGAAILNTIPLLYSQLPANVAYPAIGLLWLAALFSFIFSRGMYTAIEWAWQSEEHAERLVRQLRDRQQEINRNNILLTEATRRLERTRNELATARAYAEEARTLKERFAANISHELRTPLNLILGFAELMHLTPDIYGDMEWPVDLRRDIAQIYRSGQHLMDLINDVLDLSRLDTMQMPIRRGQAQLIEIIYEACSTFRQLIERQGLQLEIALPPDIPPLFVDAARIRQVLMNLLSNAIRHTKEGRITVGAVVNTSEVIVSVTDTGTGIPEGELTRIFEAYHRVDNSFDRRRDGAGLGLTISKRFVELHGGRIWAESIEGEGSAFFFALPIKGADGSPLLHLAARTPESMTVHPVVLLVEPDPAIAELLSRHLADVEVIRTDDLGEARALIELYNPRLVVVNVPPSKLGEPLTEPQGIEMLGLLPVVVTSLPSNSWMASVMPIHAVLSKPVSRDELLATVKRLGGGKVLIVDDDRGFVRLLARYLAGAEYITAIQYAYDGAEALRLCEADPPDLVLLDLIMPEMDGFALLDALQARPACALAQVVIVTATDYASQLLASRRGSLWLGKGASLSVQQVLRYLQAIVQVTPPADAEPPVYPAG